MSDLTVVREWMKSFPDIPKNFLIDFTNQIPGTIGLFPGGLVEIERKENLLGDITVSNQYNFALYCQLPFVPEDDAIATANADWVIDFQKWVQEQSIKKLAPTFGDHDKEKETIKAQNGALYELKEEGTALYVVMVSAQYKNLYRSDN